MGESQIIKECLDKYEVASGQLVNYSKSSISFSANVSSEMKYTIVDLLGVDYTNNHGKYLGIPSLIGRNKNEILSFIKEKAWTRMHGWRHKFLSKAGDLSRGGIRWKRWEHLSRLKKDGEMGFRRIHEFNVALLAKKGWKLLTDPIPWLLKFSRQGIFSQLFLDARLGNNPIYAWRSILASQELICSGSRKRIGTENQTKIWGETWLPNEMNPYIVSECIPELQNATVNSLRIDEVGAWDVDLLKDLFLECDQYKIKQISLSNRFCEDRWMWPDDAKGSYTVKSGYKLLTQKSENCLHPTIVNWDKVWRLNLPTKVCNFVWCVLSSCIPTRCALSQRRVQVPEWCPLCHDALEDDYHVLINCPVARSVWSLASFDCQIVAGSSMALWWNSMITNHTIVEVKTAAILRWTI